MRTVDEVLAGLPLVLVPMLPAPGYTPATSHPQGPRLGLAVESMRRHTTDEGWQLFAGLEYAGWHLCGHGLDSMTYIPDILSRYSPSVVLVQDKREWDNQHRNFREPQAMFRGVSVLSQREDVFKLTIIKDAHQRPEYHRDSAAEIGCHGWVTYYHPRIICRLAPYVRPQHLIRVYHTVDPVVVPKFVPAAQRSGTLLSGALGPAYPLRRRLAGAAGAGLLPTVRVLPHPGYDRTGCHTPRFLEELSRCRVAICTSSIYGYALRKIVEATAAGCVVVTDLPQDDELPGIDENLVRVAPGMTLAAWAELLARLEEGYGEDWQRYLSKRAVDYYSYRAAGHRLAADVERLRGSYQ